MKSTRKRMRVTELNPNLICVLCGGYFIDATTLTECLHSFCKSCIVNFLKTSKHCPVCDVMVHKTKPHLHIRSDKTLQDLVYKLVPGLYKNEMKRRRDYYSEHPLEAPSKVGEARGDENAERILYTEDEKFSLALHFCSQGVKDERSVRTLTLPEVGASATEIPKNVRYLQCPAGVTVDILKKFVRIKYELPRQYQIDIFHTDEALRDDFTLMDVAYIYTWRRKEPLKLNFSVYEFIVKRRKVECTGSRRLLDLNNLVKQENKNPADTKPDAKQDSTLLQSSAKSATGDKLGKQGQKHEKEDAKDASLVKELSAEAKSGDSSALEPMDTSTPSSSLAQSVHREAKVQVVVQSKASDGGENDALKAHNKDGNSVMNGSGPSATKKDLTVLVKKSAEKELKVSSKPVTSSLHTTTPSKPSAATPKAVLFKNKPNVSSEKSNVDASQTVKSESKPSLENPVSIANRVSNVCVASAKSVTVNGETSMQTSNSAASAQNVVTAANLTHSTTSSAKSQTVNISKVTSSRIEATKAVGGVVSKKANVEPSSALTVKSLNVTTAAAVSLPVGVVSRPASLLASTQSSQTKSTVLKPKPKAKAVSAVPASKQLSGHASVSSALSSAAAGAAGAASPSPAALAASSSPSPPMASSAACVKDTVEQPLKTSVSSHTASANPTLKASVSVPSYKQVSGTPVSLTVPVVNTGLRGVAADNSKAVPKQPATKNTTSTTPAQTTKSLPLFPGTVSQKVSSASTVGNTAAKRDTPVSASLSSANTPANNLSVKTTSSVGIMAESLKQGQATDSKNLVSNMTASSNVSPRVLAAGRGTAVGQPGGVLSGRNGMPAVVTKPTRVSNASTSVNTLLQKLPVSSPQRVAVKNSDVTSPSSPAPSRPSGTASPICKPPPKPVTSPDAAPRPPSAVSSKAPSPSPKEASKTSVSGPSGSKQPIRRTGIATTVSVQPSRPAASCAPTARSAHSSTSASVATSRPSEPSTAAPTQPARGNGASTPIPIQPLVSSSQALAMAGCSPIAVAAMRRASEMQTFQQVFAQHAKQQHQQHQQQLLEFQQLQLLQQHQQIYHAAVALARYNQLQQSSGLTSPTHLASAAAALNPAALAAFTQSPGQTQAAADSAKKQTTPEGGPKKQPQSAGGSRKGGEPSPKKKITDIANSLQKKMSQQTLGSSGKGEASPLAASDKHPPNAHTPTAPKSDSPGAGDGGGKASSGKGEDEPLNLVMSRNAASEGSTLSTGTAPTAAKQVAEKSP